MQLKDCNFSCKQCLGFVVHVVIHNNSTCLLVYNPITKECIELSQPSTPLFWYNNYAYNATCDFFEYDLQSSTYKIFLAYIKVFIFINQIEDLMQN